MNESDSAANNETVQNVTANSTADDGWLSHNMDYVYMESIIERNVFLTEMAVFFVLGVFGNSALIAVFVGRLRETRGTISTNKYNYLTMCMSVADLFVCSVCIPFSVFNRLRLSRNVAACQTMQFLCTSSVFVSTFLLVGVAVERFYAVIRPTATFSRKHVLVILGVAICASLMINTPAIPLSSVYRASTDHIIGCHIQVERPLGFYYIIALAIIVSGVSITCTALYVLLYRIICHQLSASNRAHLHPVPSSSSHAETKVHAATDEDLKRRTQSLKRTQNSHRDGESNARAAKVTFMLFGITIVFFVSWIPYVITAFGLVPYNVCLVYLFYINNCTRCITYAVTNKKLRDEIITAFRAPFRALSCVKTTTL